MTLGQHHDPPWGARLSSSLRQSLDSPPSFRTNVEFIHPCGPCLCANPPCCSHGQVSAGSSKQAHTEPAQGERTFGATVSQKNVRVCVRQGGLWQQGRGGSGRAQQVLETAHMRTVGLATQTAGKRRSHSFFAVELHCLRPVAVAQQGHPFACQARKVAHSQKKM